MSGKETMRNKEKWSGIRKRLSAMALTWLFSLCVLYGCTKKEELLLLTEDTQGQQEEDAWRQPEVPEVSGEGVQTDSGTAYIESGTGTIYVHVCGAVMVPGVYEMEAGSRVYEAVQAAGGFTEDAEESYVNQAQELSDGVKLVIPTVEEAGQQAPLVPEYGQAYTEDGRVNINVASVEELCEIPGIGAARAAAIVSYREEHGGFEGLEDIMKVNGIKEGTFEKIKGSISVK